MQVVCDGLDLSEAVIKVSRAIAYRSTNPILEGIKIVADNDYVVVSATDQELSIEKKIKAEVKVEGETVVPGRFFTEFVRKLTKEKIELSNQIFISSFFRHYGKDLKEVRPVTETSGKFSLKNLIVFALEEEIFDASE